MRFTNIACRYFVGTLPGRGGTRPAAPADPSFVPHRSIAPPSCFPNNLLIRLFAPKFVPVTTADAKEAHPCPCAARHAGAVSVVRMVRRQARKVSGELVCVVAANAGAHRAVHQLWRGCRVGRSGRGWWRRAAYLRQLQSVEEGLMLIGKHIRLQV